MVKISEKIKSIIQKNLTLEDVEKKIKELEMSIKSKEDLFSSGDIQKNALINDTSIEASLMGSGVLGVSIEKDKKKLEKLKSLKKEMLENEANKVQEESVPEA